MRGKEGKGGGEGGRGGVVWEDVPCAPPLIVFSVSWEWCPTRRSLLAVGSLRGSLAGRPRRLPTAHIYAC